jgi:hypothetical protein
MLKKYFDVVMTTEISAGFSRVFFQGFFKKFLFLQKMMQNRIYSIGFIWI